MLTVAVVGALEIAVLTLTPGADLFARFGHTAISVDEGGGKIRVFNYGAFKVHDPQLLRKFLDNRIEYYLSVRTWEDFEQHYRDRSVTSQVLALDDAEANRLVRALEWTAEPEHREYRYDWFFDNCTTRARDVIDQTLGGLMKAQLDRPGTRTMRDVLRGAEWTLPSMFHAMSLALNRRVDVPLSRWDELAMPDDLMRGLRAARRADGRPLVANEWTIEGPGRRPWIEPRALVPSLAAALLALLGAGALARRRAAGRIVAGVALALWGLACGAIGLYLVGWSLLPYRYTQANPNLIGWSPLALAWVPAGVGLALGRAGDRRWARRLCVALIAASAIELALHAVGLGRQAHLGYGGYALVATALAWQVLR